MQYLSRLSCVVSSALAIATLGAAAARSATCQDIGVNNPAFSSGLSDSRRPCTPAPSIIPTKPAVKPTSATSATKPTSATSAARPQPVDVPATVGADDKRGLIYRFGETVVCVGGSVSVTFAAGHNGAIRDHGPRPDDTCDVR